MRLKALMLVAAMALPALGQGTLNFATVGTAVGGSGAKVTDAGVGVTGANYFAQLYFSTSQNGSYTAIDASKTGFRTGAAAGFVVPLQVAVPGQLPGSTGVWVQMRAWEGAAGSSYESVAAANGKVGISNNINVGALGGTPAGGLPITDPNLTGLTGFALVAVPEPSTIALGLLGVAGLLIRRRK
jgi:hypothetical protein